MQTRTFIGKGIHGYLNPRIRFRRDITFLTGINGTGKTSIVRCVVALLQPSLAYLLETEFKELRVTCGHKGKTFEVWAKKGKGELVLGQKGSRRVLRIVLPEKDDFEPAQRFRERWVEFLSSVELESATHPTVLAIQGLPTPMFLGLERRSEAETADDRSVRVAPRRFQGLIGGNLYRSLVEARRLAESYYRQVQVAVAEETRVLRQNLILSAFSLNQPSAIGPRTPVPSRTPGSGYADRLREKRDVVMRALGALGIDKVEVDKKVRGFFGELEAAAANLPSGTQVLSLLQRQESERTRAALMAWIGLRPQERRIDELYQFVEKYMKRVDEIHAHTYQYLAAVNEFLVDSRKKLAFAANGDLAVEVGSIGARPVTALSSGESHLFVILTHLYFNPRRELASVLIIDEPELSLHIKWQEMFVNAVMGAQSDLQLILATHSPSIILDRVSHCFDLSPKRT